MHQPLPVTHIPVNIPINERVHIQGDLKIPINHAEGHVKGLVLFAHGSGSSRFSPRNNYVAQQLHQVNLATLLVDLLTRDEEQEDEYTREHRFNIGMLADRLVAIVGWVKTHDFGSNDAMDAKNWNIGLFGASTGGGAAIVAAAQLRESIGAVVSRGGRPDLAGNALEKVTVPTLLLVGGWDNVVIDLNRKAFNHLHNCNQKKLTIVPEATHLFEETGKLEEVSQLAAEWFSQFLKK